MYAKILKGAPIGNCNAIGGKVGGCGKGKSQDSNDDVDGAPLKEGQFSEGDPVRATRAYGGKSGEIADARDGKSFVVVRHKDGSKASYHYSDLVKNLRDDDEDS